MAKKRVTLIFPQQLIKEPVVYNVTKETGIVFNIRRAKVTATVGEMVLELEGPDEKLEQSVKLFEQKGVKVEPVTGDVVS